LDHAVECTDEANMPCSICFLPSDVNTDLRHKNQDQVFSVKDQDKDQDFTAKDKDQDKDYKSILKDSSRTRTRTNVTALTGRTCRRRPGKAGGPRRRWGC